MTCVAQIGCFILAQKNRSVNPFPRRHRSMMYLSSGIYECAALSTSPSKDEALTAQSLGARSLITSVCPETSRAS